MQGVNEPIDPQSPFTDRPEVIGKSGVLFLSQIRDATGASGGSASGVYTSAEHYNINARGVRLNVVIAPTGAATGTVTVNIEVPDPVSNSSSGTVWTTLGGTVGANAFVLNGTGALTGALFTLYPGLTGIADASGASGVSGGTTLNQHLGRRWRAKVTLANAPLTFTIGADYLL